MRIQMQRRDLLASLVVFVVALPLSLGIALASGGSLASGLISAIVGGLVVGALSGAPLTVSGPAAGLSALVFQLIQQHGITGLAIITIIAGVIQVSLGALGWGRAISWIPKPVLEGTLSAIGLIIMLGQLHVLMGQPIPKSPVAAILSLDESVGRSIASPEGGAWIAPVLACGLLGIAVELAWRQLAKRSKSGPAAFIALIPAALPAVVIATLASLSYLMPRVELSAFAPVVTENLSSLRAALANAPWFDLTLAAAGLAFVASAESLLTARAVATYSPEAAKVPLNLNRELVAQGVGNTIAGVAGGIPITAVMVRSAANVDSGARSRWSTILHGAWILAFVALLPSVLEKIPLTALAAVLILTGFKLLQIPKFLEAARTHRSEALIWVATAGAILATDLLKGLIIGMAFAGAIALLQRMRTRATLSSHAPGS